jgi:hypothetical protein
MEDEMFRKLPCHRLQLQVMVAIDGDSIFKQLTRDRARLRTLGLTEEEILKFYRRCGPEGQARAFDQAIAELNARFQFSDADAAFVADALASYSPWGYWTYWP